MALHDGQLKSRRFSLFDQLYGVYALEPGPAEISPEPGISPVIVPTIDVAGLYLLANEEAILDLQAAAGTFVAAFTVPALERWHLQQIDFPATTANGAGRLTAPDGTPTLLKDNDTNALVLFQQIKDWRLDEGWQVGMTTTGNAGDAARTLRLLWYRERLN